MPGKIRRYNEPISKDQHFVNDAFDAIAAGDVLKAAELFYEAASLSNPRANNLFHTRELAAPECPSVMQIETDNRLTLFQFGICHLIGLGCNTDDKAARKLLKQSAAKGEPRAHVLLYFMYADAYIGQEMSESLRRAEQERHLDTAIAQDNLLAMIAKATLILRECNTSSHVTLEQEHQVAIQLLQRASRLGSGLAMYQLALFSEMHHFNMPGMNEQTSLTKVISLYEAALANGMLAAAYKLAQLYLEGDAGKDVLTEQERLVKAVEYYRIAITAEVPAAADELSDMYQLDLVEQNMLGQNKVMAVHYGLIAAVQMKLIGIPYQSDLLRQCIFTNITPSQAQSNYLVQLIDSFNTGFNSQALPERFDDYVYFAQFDMHTYKDDYNYYLALQVQLPKWAEDIAESTVLFKKYILINLIKHVIHYCVTSGSIDCSQSIQEMCQLLLLPIYDSVFSDSFTDCEQLAADLITIAMITKDKTTLWFVVSVMNHLLVKNNYLSSSKDRGVKRNYLRMLCKLIFGHEFAISVPAILSYDKLTMIVSSLLPYVEHIEMPQSTPSASAADVAMHPLDEESVNTDGDVLAATAGILVAFNIHVINVELLKQLCANLLASLPNHTSTSRKDSIVSYRYESNQSRYISLLYEGLSSVVTSTSSTNAVVEFERLYRQIPRDMNVADAGKQAWLSLTDIAEQTKIYKNIANAPTHIEKPKK